MLCQYAQGSGLKEKEIEDDPLSPDSREKCLRPEESGEATENGFGLSPKQSTGAGEDVLQARMSKLLEGINGVTLDDGERGNNRIECERLNADRMGSWILLPNPAEPPTAPADEVVPACLPTSGAPDKQWVVIPKVPSTEMPPTAPLTESPAGVAIGTAASDEPNDPAGKARKHGADGPLVAAQQVDDPVDLYQTSGFNLDISWDDLIFDRPKVLLGEGAFGRVYKALYLSMRVAVKKFAPNCTDVSTTDTLENELKVLAAAGVHQNVVACYGGCLKPPCVFIVEEEMDKSLYDLVHSCDWGPKPLPIRQILNLGQDITAGICHLHPKIVHRDLKPQVCKAVDSPSHLTSCNWK